jgi:hypothetical protein
VERQLVLLQINHRFLLGVLILMQVSRLQDLFVSVILLTFLSSPSSTFPVSSLAQTKNTVALLNMVLNFSMHMPKPLCQKSPSSQGKPMVEHMML